MLQCIASGSWKSDVFGANRRSVDDLALFRANYGSRPSLDNLPHVKFPTLHSRDHILDSTILI